MRFDTLNARRVFVFDRVVDEMVVVLETTRSEPTNRTMYRYEALEMVFRRASEPLDVVRELAK